MDMQKFKAAYSESRNGANKMFRHPLVRRFVRGQSAQLLISMNRCCEKALPLGKATCPDCEEASAGYQAAMTSTETPPWE